MEGRDEQMKQPAPERSREADRSIWAETAQGYARERPVSGGSRRDAKTSWVEGGGQISA
jgi:hypothetical protein